MSEHQAMQSAGEGERLYADGRFAEAADAFQRSVDTLMPLVSENALSYVPQIAGQLNNLALCLTKLGEQDQAVNRLEVSIALLGRYMEDFAWAATDPMIRHMLGAASQSLAALFVDMGRNEEAIEIVDRVVLLRRGGMAPGVLQADDRLAVTLRLAAEARARAGSDLERAEAHAAEAVRIYEALAEGRPDEFHPEMCRALEVLANVLDRRGRRGEAALLREWLTGQTY